MVKPLLVAAVWFLACLFSYHYGRAQRGRALAGMSPAIAPGRARAPEVSRASHSPPTDIPSPHRATPSSPLIFRNAAPRRLGMYRFGSLFATTPSYPLALAAVLLSRELRDVEVDDSVGRWAALRQLGRESSADRLADRP